MEEKGSVVVEVLLLRQNRSLANSVRGVMIRLP